MSPIDFKSHYKALDAMTPTQPPASEEAPRISEEDIAFAVKRYNDLLGGGPLTPIIRQYQRDLTELKEAVKWAREKGILVGFAAYTEAADKHHAQVILNVLEGSEDTYLQTINK